MHSITLGFPQGSILKPILFINDLSKLCLNIDHSIVNYANDTNVLVKAADFNSLTSEGNYIFRSFVQWFAHNKLFINKEKNGCILFRTKQSNLFIFRGAVW